MSELSESEQFRMLFVGRLRHRTTEESLKSHFEKWGEIVHCIIIRDGHSGKSRGYGFITYKHACMVDKAVAARPHKIDGKEVLTQRADSCERKRFRMLFIGGLNDKSNEESLMSHFKKWGEIEICDVARETSTGKSRGFAFITYKRARMIDDVQAARPHKIDGQEVETRRIDPKGRCRMPDAHGTLNTLFVWGLGKYMGEEDLRECFGTYGNIVSVNIPIDKATGKTKGYAFVEFDDYDPVDKIILLRHNYRGKKLHVKKSLPRETMKMSAEMVGLRQSEGASRFDRRGGECFSGEYGSGEGGGWDYGYGDCYSGAYGYDDGYPEAYNYDDCYPEAYDEDDAEAYGYDDWYSGAYGYYDYCSGAYGYDGSYSGAYGYDGSYSGAYGYDGSYSGACGYSDCYSGADGDCYSGAYGYDDCYSGDYAYDGSYSGAWNYVYDDSYIRDCSRDHSNSGV